jgi:hypothetical protein
MSKISNMGNRKGAAGLIKFTDKEIREMSQVSGKVSGGGLLEDYRVLKGLLSAGDLKKFEDASGLLNPPLDYGKIKEFSLYPAIFNARFFYLIKKLFKWDDIKLREAGKLMPKTSWITRFFLRYLVSGEIIKKSAPKYWREYYTDGDLIVTKFEEGQGMEMEEAGMEIPPPMLVYLEGATEAIYESFRKGAICKTERIVRSGGNVYKFKIKWGSGAADSAVYFSEQEKEEMARVKGKMRGMGIMEDLRALERIVGKKEVERFKKISKNLDPPLDYDAIKEVAWYPSLLDVRAFYLMRKIFGWNDEN